MFNPGDVVKLKSDGPQMTVSKIISPTYVEVYWFDQSVKTSELPAVTLRLSTPHSDEEEDDEV